MGASLKRHNLSRFFHSLYLEGRFIYRVYRIRPITSIRSITLKLRTNALSVKDAINLTLNLTLGC